MSQQFITNARKVFNLPYWGDDYFDINDAGQVVVRPDGRREVVLESLIEKLQPYGMQLPTLVRFTDILANRIEDLHHGFATAMRQFDYSARYTAVYPIKVNQQRRVVEAIVQQNKAGQEVGLESGSKPELMIALALATGDNFKIVCNGYKDREYIRLALIGQQLGHRVMLIVEKLTELELIFAEAQALNVVPCLGIRIRLQSVAKGKWQNTGGKKSKFGLTADQLIDAIALLKQHQWLDQLQVLHIHMGSQIANIRDIQRGMLECARYFVELRRLGANIQTIDVGGGLGVDYEGARSRSDCSMNYSLQEYANKVVQALAEACQQENIPQPNIITEAGRAMAAHHAVLLVKLADQEINQPKQPPPTVSAVEPLVLQDLALCLERVGQISIIESFHDAKHFFSEAEVQYVHGQINLTQRAGAESLYNAVCFKIHGLLQSDKRAHREISEELNDHFSTKLIGNFSIFQSIPDAWAIRQVFPVLPLTGLNQALTERAVLHDITCDSDGQIQSYIESEAIESTMPWVSDCHYVGIFLVGAYQEILGDMHNLFGDTDSVHVELTDDGDYRFIEPLTGDGVDDVLRTVQFDAESMLQIYREKVAASSMVSTSSVVFAELRNGLSGYTYLED